MDINDNDLDTVAHENQRQPLRFDGLDVCVANCEEVEVIALVLLSGFTFYSSSVLDVSDYGCVIKGSLYTGRNTPANV